MPLCAEYGTYTGGDVGSRQHYRGGGGREKYFKRRRDVKGTRAGEGAGTDGWEKVENGSGPEEEKGSG